MELTTKQALTAYAEMMNSCDSSNFEKLLADDLVSTSQAVLTDITSKAEFVTYIRGKLQTIKQSNATVYAELGELNAYGHSECVVIAQGNKDNLVATAFITVKDNKVKQIDLCSVPPPSQAKRSGIYPTPNKSVPNTLKNLEKSNKSLFDLFVSAEVRWVREEIRNFFNQHNYFCSDSAMKEALSTAGQADKTKYSIRVDGLKPQEIALIIIRNVAFHKLISGRYHTYRNTLSTSGKDYLKLFNDAIAQSVSAGFTTEKDAQEEREELLAFIKNLG